LSKPVFDEFAKDLNGFNEEESWKHLYLRYEDQTKISPLHLQEIS